MSTITRRGLLATGTATALATLPGVQFKSSLTTFLKARDNARLGLVDR